MSNSVVPAAAVAHAKQLVKNKKLTKRTDDQKPAQDEQQPVHHDQDVANAVQVDHADAKSSMSATSMSGDFSFGGALSAAAAGSASLIAESAQDDGGSVGDDGDGAGGTILLVGAVGLAGLGVAVLAGGGGKNNEAPNITSASTAAIAENAAATTVVYTTVATDPDGDALTYSLTGADAAAFNISSTGVVTLKAPADFEAKSSYAFSVVASDGELTDTQAVALTITNVTGAGDPPSFTSGTTASIAENSATSAVVYDANVVGTGATFALTGADAALFTIDADDGEVRFISSPNFESRSSYAIGVIATREGGSVTQNVAVSVTDVVEPGPSFTSATTAAVNEEQPANTVVYDANATGTGNITFALSGTNASAFQIDPSNGQIRFLESPDFETDPTSYTVTVSATDSNGTTSQNVVITLNDVSDEPASISLDQGDPTDDAFVIDLADGPVVLTEDSDEDSNVVITNFTADDLIQLIGNADVGDYNFGTGNAVGGDANDLAITLNDNDSGNNIILIEDVLVNAGPVFNYETAVDAVGFEFINFG
jgi:hypothetical protein